jgi:hypothetical protein
MAHELVGNIMESNLNTRAVKLMDMENWLVKRQMQELATAQQRLEELKAS